MQVSASSPREMGGLSYKWIVLIVMIFGLFMSILDSTIVNIAVPRLQTAFGADLNTVQWVLTGYTLAQGVATPLTGFLSDRIGIKRFYLISLVSFTIGSALCGIAWSLPTLIVFRILQGAGGAFLFPLSMTLMYREFPPHERGLAMGVLGIPILLAPALGPTVGGYIVTYAGWQLIFYINLPVGIVGLIMGLVFLREGETHAGLRLDLPGFVFSAAGLAALLYGLSDASTDGWGSGKVLGFIIVGVLLLIVFVFVELGVARRGEQPLLDMSVFANGPFSTSSFASILVTFALYGGLFLVPIYLQDLRGLSAYQAGLILLPQAFASMVAVVIGGRLVDRFGVRAVVIPGLALLVFVLWRLSFITLTMSYSSFQVLLILRGFALGLCMQPLSVSALSEIRSNDLARASAVSTTLRFIASSLGIAVLATLVQTQTKVHYAHLAERVTASSPLGQLVPMIQALFMSHGASSGAAHGAALSVIYGMLQQQASLLAMQDGYLITAALGVLALVASFFVRSRKQVAPAPEQQATMTQEEREEAERAREEAALAV
jgi:DHA2 family multidrug resistance protein